MPKFVSWAALFAATDSGVLPLRQPLWITTNQSITLNEKASHLCQPKAESSPSAHKKSIVPISPASIKKASRNTIRYNLLSRNTDLDRQIEERFTLPATPRGRSPLCEQRQQLTQVPDTPQIPLRTLQNQLSRPADQTLRKRISAKQSQFPLHKPDAADAELPEGRLASRSLKDWIWILRCSL